MPDLHLTALDYLARADQLNGLRHHADESFVIDLDAAEQLDLILRNELEPVEVVTELVELAERRIERPFVGQEQRRRNAIELRRRVVLDLAIRGDLAL